MTKAMGAVAAIAAVLAGCASEAGDRPGSPSMQHKVNVPPQYSAGRGSEWAQSAQEGYIDAYERGWWACVNDCAADIRHRSDESDRSASGWPYEVEGFERGYLDAEARVRLNIRMFGEDRTRKHLAELLSGQ